MPVIPAPRSNVIHAADLAEHDHPADQADRQHQARLAPPTGRPRVVIDTDAANEIDDPFALAWALLSPAQLQLEAVYAAPYSFAHRRAEMLRARLARDRPQQASDEDRALLALHRDKLAHFERQGWDVATLALPPFDPPERGMQRSLEEIERVFALLGQPSAGRVFAGSTGYLHSLDSPERSPAASHLIELAMATPAEGAPLYVLAIGCVTNIASALLLEPRIAERIVVVWTAGYPSHAPHANRAFNLEQDVLASQWLFDCGVPLVYLPGYHVGAQLRLTAPEVEQHVKGCGEIGNHLHHLYTHNPLWPLLGIDSLYAHSWVIWDLINLAWVMQPDWVPSALVRTPRLGNDLRWQAAPDRPWMREAHAVNRDAIFRDLFQKLEALRGS